MLRPILSSVAYTYALACFAQSAEQAVSFNSVCTPETLNPIPYDKDLFRKDDEVVEISGEFLYWTAQEGGLDYSVEMKSPNPSSAGPWYAVGKSQNASFHISPGVRVSASYFNAPKYWEVKCQYTHLTFHGKNRASKPRCSNEYLTGTWPEVPSDGIVKHAHSDIDLNYNLFDYIVDRVFITNPHLKLRMIAGASAAWMKQHWKTEYFSENETTKIRNKWHFVGGGMRAGLTTDWYWGKDIYLTGATTTAVFLGTYTNQYRQISSVSNRTLIADNKYEDLRPAFCIQFIAGPSIQKNLPRHRFEVFIGYELDIWANLHEVRRSSPSETVQGFKAAWVTNSLLAVQGLTSRITFDF